jgi:hypothetical protein
MALDAINNFLVQEANRIGVDINQKLMNTSPWINLTLQEAWPEGMGASIKTFEFDRPIIRNENMEVGNEFGWDNVSLNDAADDGGTCIPNADRVEFSQTHRDYNLQQVAAWGPRICVNDLRYTFVREKQMGASVNALAMQARLKWISRFRDEYRRVADNVVLADEQFALVGGGFGYKTVNRGGNGGLIDETSISTLTAGYLEYVYEYLNHQSAQEYSAGKEDGAPVYTLITSARTSQRIIKETDTRNDFRFSDRVGELLRPMGVKFSYDGFIHTADSLVDRWELFNDATSNGTVYVSVDATTGIATIQNLPAGLPVLDQGSEIVDQNYRLLVTGRVPGASDQVYVVNDDGSALVTGDLANPLAIWFKIHPYAYQDLGSGLVKRIPNPAWLGATYEDSYIFVDRVYTSLVPKPITSVGKAKFDPVNYRGEFSWKMYDDEESNPDGNIGRFRGVFMNGSRPDNPEWGIVIRHKACPNAFGAITTCPA